MRTLIINLILILSINNLFAQECLQCNNCYKKNKWKLLKKEGVKVDTITAKINGVYISETEMNGKLYYEFIRFFNDGRVFYSCTYCSFPTEAQLNNLGYGKFGQYVINNGLIKVEVYGAYRGYHFCFYETSGSQISYSATCNRRWPEKRNKEYIKTKRVYKYYSCQLY